MLLFCEVAEELGGKPLRLCCIPELAFADEDKYVHGGRVTAYVPNYEDKEGKLVSGHEIVLALAKVEKLPRKDVMWAPNLDHFAESLQRGRTAW